METVGSSKSLESASQLKPEKRLFSFLLSNKVPPVPSEDERKVYPEGKANIISRIFFWWLLPVMTPGYRRTMQEQDLFKLSDDLTVKTIADRFNSNLENQLAKAKTSHLKKKLKERGETEGSSSVSEEEDMEDFQISGLLMVKSVLLTYKWQYSIACLFLICSNVSTTCNPLLTKKLISYVEHKAYGLELGVGKGVGYAIGCSALVLLNALFTNHFFYRSMLTGAQARAMLTKAILDKSFNLSAGSKQTYTSGKITSFMSTDLARIDFALGFSPFLLTFPIPFAIAIAILIVNIGASALVGVGLMLIFICFILAASRLLFVYRDKANKFTDSRVNSMKEVLTNLKVIKFYSWEVPYFNIIAGVRRQEMHFVYKMQIVRNVFISLAMTMPLFASMIAFLVLYATRKSNGNPADIFSSVSLFSGLTQQVIMLPIALSSGSDALKGLVRVGRYLGSEEVEKAQLDIDASPEKKDLMDKENLAVSIEDASFKWLEFNLDEQEDGDVNEKDGKKGKERKEDQKVKKGKAGKSGNKLEDKKKYKETDESSQDEIEVDAEESKKFSSDSTNSSSPEEIPPFLKNVNLDIKKGDFVVITGSIGSGKSSLLSAISGFMEKSEGDLNVNGSLILCGQPWVQNATVKENIIFGSEFDRKRYDDIIYASSLESDLTSLPAGDNTEIGERGITLSGGQKARINFARAVYANKDIILMDDVLSAVDARVGKHIMESCILGLLKNKTRVLATHQISLIGQADKVVYMNGDGTIDCGTFEELKARNSQFVNLMQYNKDEGSDDENDDDQKLDTDNDEEEREKEREYIQRQLSRLQTNTEDDDEAVHKDFHKNEAEDGTLIREEERAVNKIKLKVYKRYVEMGKGSLPRYSLLVIVFICMVLATFAQLFTNTWLSFWIDYKFGKRTDGFYIGLYVMFCVLSVILLTMEFIGLAYMANKAAEALNIKSLHSVLYAPMSFMDTTPVGRALNRFTKDTDSLDNEITDSFRLLFYTLSYIVGVMILCIIYLPWFAIAVPILVTSFVGLASFYQASAREVKRLEAIKRSLVYNNFNEVLGGMSTIRAYRQENRFMRKNESLIDRMNEAYYITIGNQRWLSIQLDLVAVIMCLIISLLCVFRIFNISAASVGLLISYVLQIGGQLSLMIRTFTQLENEMNSAERLCHYAFDLQQEAPYLIKETEPKPTWPENASIKFDHVSLAYRPGLPLVLKDVDFEVKPGEKIGICGRTGAGKSSIITALYRISELDKGKIIIDDVDVSRLGVNTLRSKLAIIPQDPVLFRGTLKKNLDPFGEHSDETLWSALRRAGLIESEVLDEVKTQSPDGENLHKFHLEKSVEDDGNNFSLGERQLIAFARALIKDTKFLILDEATSSVDYETDAKIQRTIVEEFSSCTILCIAHRLKTIVNYDKILVLDNGEVKEFDTPLNLFNKEESIFRQMCNRSHIVDEDFERK